MTETIDRFISCRSTNWCGFGTDLHWLVFIFGLCFCLCEAVKLAHIHSCGDQHFLSQLFPLMSAYFTSASYINRPVCTPWHPPAFSPFHSLLYQIGSGFQIINFHVTFGAACIQITFSQSSDLTWNTLFFLFFPPLTSSFFGLVHRPPVYLSFFSCPEAMDRKAGCVTVQPTLPETAVSTLDFVRAERDQLLVSGAFLM